MAQILVVISTYIGDIEKEIPLTIYDILCERNVDKNKKQLRDVNEILTQHLLQLDAVESCFRENRKQLILKIQIIQKSIDTILNLGNNFNIVNLNHPPVSNIDIGGSQNCKPKPMVTIEVPPTLISEQNTNSPAPYRLWPKNTYTNVSTNTSSTQTFNSNNGPNPYIPWPNNGNGNVNTNNGFNPYDPFYVDRTHRPTQNTGIYSFHPGSTTQHKVKLW